MNARRRIFPFDLNCYLPWGRAQRGVDASPTFQRLVEEYAMLSRLEVERVERGEPNFGKAIEERILWRELLELELQDVDEQIERIAGAAERWSDDVS